MSELTYTKLTLIPNKEPKEETNKLEDLTWSEFCRMAFKTVAHWKASLFLPNATSMTFVGEDGTVIEYRKVSGD